MRDQFKFNEAHAEKAEEVLEKLESELIHTLDAHRLGILVFDINGDLLTCNQQWERLYQLSYSEVADYNVLEDTNLHKKPIWEPVRMAFNGTAGVMEENYFSPEEWGKQGRARWTEGNVLPLFDRQTGDKILGTAIFLQDITERKMTAFEVEQLREFLTGIKNQQEHISRSLAELLPTLEESLRSRLPSQRPVSKSIRDRAKTIPRREREVFEKLAAGYTVKEAAHQLQLGIKSVYTYRARLLKRLQLSGDVELAIAWREIHERPQESHPETDMKRDEASPGE